MNRPLPKEHAPDPTRAYEAGIFGSHVPKSRSAKRQLPDDQVDTYLYPRLGSAGQRLQVEIWHQDNISRSSLCACVWHQTAVS